MISVVVSTVSSWHGQCDEHKDHTQSTVNALLAVDVRPRKKVVYRCLFFAYIHICEECYNIYIYGAYIYIYTYIHIYIYMIHILGKNMIITHLLGDMTSPGRHWGNHDIFTHYLTIFLHVSTCHMVLSVILWHYFLISYYMILYYVIRNYITWY